TAKPGVFKGPQTVGPKGVPAANNPTANPGATGRGSLDGTQRRADQKPLPQGPGKAAPLANGEIGPDRGKHALGEPHETGSDAGKHAPSPMKATHGGRPVAQDGSGPHGNKNKDDKDNRPATTQGM